MRRIRITIAYDGTGFSGFQLQPEARTVEGELNRALTELTGEEIRVIGASRTDSGVHALGNVAVFDTASPIPAERFPFALQAFLPDDLRVTSGCETAPDWHPRKTDCVKTYEYVYSCSPVEDPLKRRYCSFQRRVPDTEAMKKAARYLVGEHDFTSFANPSSQQLQEGKSAVRTISAIEITKEENPDSFLPGGAGPVLIRIRITGNGFLYNMVRIIAGTLMNVGVGLWKPERVEDALLAKDRTKAGPTAEARGLTLIGIRYMESGAGAEGGSGAESCG